VRKNGRKARSGFLRSPCREQGGASFGVSRPYSWYSKGAVKDVGFMVSEKRRPQQEERLFCCGGAPVKKGGLQIWPKER
jgi:hypothetical protein